MEDFEDLVVLRGNTEVISLNVLMAFTAYGQNFYHNLYLFNLFNLP